MVLLAATAIRLYGINFGLPYVSHSDEPTNYNVIIGMLNSGDPNPHFFNYPSLSLYAHLAVASAISLIGQVFGVYDSSQDIAAIDVLAMGVGKIPNPLVFLSMRVLTAAVGIERWRHHYNTVRPHSSLGYRPPAPQAVLPRPAVRAYATRQILL